MSRGPTLQQPSPRFVAGSAWALAAVLFSSILTMWVTRWSVSLLEAGVLALAAVWSGLMVFRPGQVRGSCGATRWEIRNYEPARPGFCTHSIGWGRVDRRGAADDGSHGQSVVDVECGPSVDDIPRVVFCGWDVTLPSIHVFRRHGRACPGHPRLALRPLERKAWMPGTRPGMTCPKHATGHDSQVCR